MTILVTGGFGFIGSNFIHKFAQKGEFVVNIDNQGFAANPKNLDGLLHTQAITFLGNIIDRNFVANVINQFPPRMVIHFAAETHVDRSIISPEGFVASNFVGTCALLEVVYDYYRFLKAKEIEGWQQFKFIHVSTDEVYGSLSLFDDKFTELTPYAPNSPYSATKAASDHMVRAYNRTYGLPTVITHCSNNYGPRQHPEKFIPTIIRSLMQGKKIPVYGQGTNMRDWIYVDDHNDAIIQCMDFGKPGDVYNFGGDTEISNLKLASAIARVMGQNPDDVIEYVEDRPGHDFRYAIDNTKAIKTLMWQPKVDFISGLMKTIEWYNNEYKDTWNNSVSGEQQPSVSSDVSSNEATPAGLR